MGADTITAIATCVTAVIALIAAIIAIWQVRFTTRLQVLLQCDSTWMSEPMRSTRRKAANSLLKGDPTVDVDNVLDFFETMAGIFLKPRIFPILPDDWARHTFYWPAVCYWSKSRDYIESVRGRETESAAWNDFCELIPRWIEIEGCAPTEQDIKDFLNDEKK